MFFILSKILDFIIAPIVWSIGLLIYSLFSRIPKRKKIALITSLSVLLFFSNSFIFDECMRLWEVKTTSKESIKEPYDYGIVMGGMITFDSKFDRINFVRSVDRILQAVELYKLGKIKKIFITSGTGSLKEPEMKEALILKKYLVNIGFPAYDIITESASRNTYENAKYTVRLLGKNTHKKFILITSASHMRRSLACMKKAGLVADPYVADRYAGPRKFHFDHLFLPKAQVLDGWDTLIHDVIGYMMYKFNGYL